MKSIDVKSLLIGILGTALVMVLMGLSFGQKNYEVECVIEGLEHPQRVLCRKFNLDDALFNTVFPGKDTNSWSVEGFYLGKND